VTAPSNLTEALMALIAQAVEVRVAELQRPIFVTQRTVERVLSMPAGRYLELARAGAFSCRKDQRLVYARTEDVAAFVEAVGSDRRAVAANDDDEARAFARYGARRVRR
jgi:hypothetical protein